MLRFRLVPVTLSHVLPLPHGLGGSTLGGPEDTIGGLPLTGPLQPNILNVDVIARIVYSSMTLRDLTAHLLLGDST